MDVKELKAATSDLPRIDQLAAEFEGYLNVQGLEQLRKSLKEIKYGQVVNDKLASLAHQLFDLKLASVMSDHKKTKRIINSFLKDPHGGIRRVIFEVPYLESQLSLLNTAYNTLNNLPLEHTIILTEGNHVLKKMLAVSEQQKKYLSLIGKHFVEMTRELKKEFKKA